LTLIRQGPVQPGAKFRRTAVRGIPFVVRDRWSIRLKFPLDLRSFLAFALPTGRSAPMISTTHLGTLR